MANCEVDVRALLLCTTKNSDQHKCIKKFTESGKKEFSVFTSFDATQTLFIYPSEKGDSWLQSVWADRELAAKQVAPGIRCRPMHLVSEQEATSFWKSGEEKPFLLMTVVYGVNHKYYSSDIGNYSNDSAATNDYERAIKRYLSALGGGNEFSEKIAYMVYNTMDVGDIVVLWFTSDIHYGFEQAISISQTGLARKTHTSLYFPLEITSCKISLAAAARTLIFNQKNFQISITGAIRDHQQFKDSLLPQLRSALGLTEKDGPDFMLGRDDFRLANSNAKADNLAATLAFFMSQLNEDKSICWTIRGYCSPISQCDDNGGAEDSCGREAPEKPTPLLDEVYEELARFWKPTSKTSFDPIKYPWANALRELLGVYATMDSDPALHGPGYLIYDCASVFNDYLAEKVELYKGSALVDLLQASEESILRYVECLSQLTDRLVRMDELTLGGVGGYSPIYGMLPESMLRFCNGFVRKFVDLLIDIDNCKGIGPKKDDFAYAFLLFPELGGGMRISQVLQTKTKDLQDWQKSLLKQQNSQLIKTQIFPTRQLYLLEFPAEDMYRPEIFFPQIFHECLHRFGDALRQRNKRKQYMAAYLAMCAMSWINLDGNGSDDAKKLHRELAQKLYSTEYSTDQVPASTYLETAKNDFVEKLRKIFSPDARVLAELAETMNGALALRSNFMLRRWIQIAGDRGETDEEIRYGEDRFRRSVEECAYFFRECYADAMMIEFTGLEPTQYLELMKSELDRENTQDYALIQRIAIVLSACHLVEDEQSSSWQNERIKAATQKIPEEFKNKCCALYSSLTEPSANEEPGGANQKEDGAQGSRPEGGRQKNGPEKEHSYYRPDAALRYVVDYIVYTIKEKRAFLKGTGRALEPSVQEIRDNFSCIAVNKAFFGKTYYKIFQDEHTALKRRKNKKFRNESKKSDG